MLNKLAYIWYQTTDMDRTVEFYQKVLGLKLLFKREDWSEFDIDGQRLAFSKVDTHPENNDSFRPGVSFLAQPIEQMIADLSRKGVQFTDELKVYPYGKLASFRDPDGNTLGLYEPPPLKEG